jgi:Fe-S cluster biosynthesis and repair protein YggX
MRGKCTGIGSALRSGMSDPNERIARFEHMANADPTNEMAHFSLGSAYLQQGRAGEAAKAFEKCLELNPDMSKAWQMAGEAMIKAGWSDKAASILSRGYEVAAKKGDNMPRDAMAALLKSIGREPPKVAGAAATSPANGAQGTEQFICQRTGKAGTRLPSPPMKGPVGQWIRENISAETWRAWIGQGTKVINELRLDFSRDQDQAIYEQYMHEYLGIDDELKAKLGVPTTAPAPPTPALRK